MPTNNYKTVEIQVVPLPEGGALDLSKPHSTDPLKLKRVILEKYDDGVRDIQYSIQDGRQTELAIVFAGDDWELVYQHGEGEVSCICRSTLLPMVEAAFYAAARMLAVRVGWVGSDCERCDFREENKPAPVDVIAALEDFVGECGLDDDANDYIYGGLRDAEDEVYNDDNDDC